jgi:opacity protein-like surface antigen
MKRTIAAATLLISLSAAASAFAQYPPQQYPPQQYPPQQYPPQQQYAPPQQGYPPPQQGYPAQPYQQPMAPAPYAAPPTAAASTSLGGVGQVIISADRLFGLSFWSAKEDLDNNDSDSASGTQVNLLWGDTNGFGPYSTPRLGVDYTVARSLSIGGSVGLVSKTETLESTRMGVTASQDAPSVTAFAFTPRVGYILDINPMFGIWFKGGITYFNSKTSVTRMQNGASVTGTDTISGFALNIEPELVLQPVPHFGLTLGGVADISLSGTSKSETTGAVSTSTEHNYKINNFGIIAGILGYI